MGIDMRDTAGDVERWEVGWKETKMEEGRVTGGGEVNKNEDMDI